MKRKNILWFASMMLLLAGVYGCSKSERAPGPIAPETKAFTCEGCHTNAAQLQELAPPDTISQGNAGEG